MQEEYDALIRNDTWALVPPRPGQNVVAKKWVFRIKQNPEGSIARYKARFAAKGFHQQLGIDFHETFSHVINPITVHTVLSIALNHKWGLHRLDVNNAFLNGHLTEEVYMAQLQGMLNADYLHHVYWLHKAIYGLKEAQGYWYQELIPSCSLLTLSHPVRTRPSLFTLVVMCSSISWFMLII